MGAEEPMTIDERRKYLYAVKKRYVQARRKEKAALLDEMEDVTKMHRKSLTRLMNSSLARRPRKKQRGRTYGAEVDAALQIVYESWDYICAERLTSNLVWMAQHLAAHGELTATPELMQKLACLPTLPTAPTTADCRGLTNL